MKKWCSCVVLLCLSFFYAGCEKDKPVSYSIVFVHIGDTLPSYLKTAIEQAALFNPRGSLYLVANERAIQGFSEQLNLPNFKIFTCESLKKTQEHATFCQESGLNKVFRNGFMFFASERFFYLNDLIQQLNLKHVFHLESDNMLYVNLEDLVPIFAKHYHGIGATFDAHLRCIPGFVYISEQYAMKRLVRFMADNAKRNEDDMKTLARYRNKNNKRWVDTLPIITNEYIKENPLKTKRKTHVFSNHVKRFDSIFDAAALGQYLGGQDPRNGVSSAGFINETCVFNPALLEILWKTDEQGRKIPYVKHGEKHYRINNLHVHSKNLTAFAS